MKPKSIKLNVLKETRNTVWKIKALEPDKNLQEIVHKAVEDRYKLLSPQFQSDLNKTKRRKNGSFLPKM